MPRLCKQCRTRSVGFWRANWSGSALFVIKYANLYQQLGSSNLIGWKVEVGVVSKFIQHDKGYMCSILWTIITDKVFNFLINSFQIYLYVCVVQNHSNFTIVLSSGTRSLITFPYPSNVAFGFKILTLTIFLDFQILSQIKVSLRLLKYITKKKGSVSMFWQCAALKHM